MTIKTCPECGKYSTFDNARHNETHYGMHAKPQHLRSPIWQAMEQPTKYKSLVASPDSIICVTASSPKWLRRRAAKVVGFANFETNYGGLYDFAAPPGTDRDRHLFLYHRGGRFVGVVIFDRRKLMYELSWEEYERHLDIYFDTFVPSTNPVQRTPFWTLNYVWVHRHHRRKGIASQLLSVGVDHLGTELHQLGILTPITKSARGLAQSLWPSGPRVAWPS